ncbi:hypothetical protein IKS57_02210 [bacterium]|nr:hypothetical protein [bacterium]
MERLSNNNEVDLTEIYKQIDYLDHRVDLLYYLNQIEMNKTTDYFYVNDAPTSPIVRNEYNRVFFININQNTSKDMYVWAEDNHVIEIVFINCVLNKVVINYNSSSVHFYNCVVNDLFFEKLQSDNIDFPIIKNELRVNELIATNYTIDLTNNKLKKVNIFEVNPVGGTYTFIITLPNTLNDVYFNCSDFNLSFIIEGNDYVNDNYFSEFYIYANTISHLKALKGIDLSQTYDNTKFYVYYNTSDSSTILSCTIHPTLIGCFKTPLKTFGLRFNQLSFIDVKPVNTSTSYIDGSWLNESLTSTIWQILRFDNYSVMIDTVANFKLYLQKILNANLNVVIGRSYGL